MYNNKAMDQKHTHILNLYLGLKPKNENRMYVAENS